MLVADRRKVVNYFKVGMIGLRDEPKITKTPYCLYGTTGFEFSPHEVGANAKTTFEQKLSVICALNFFTEDRFTKHRMFKTIKDIRAFARFRLTCRRIRDLIGHRLSKDMDADGSGLLVMTHENTFVGDGKGWSKYSNQEALIVGSGKKMAAILLDHGVPTEEIYYALRLSGCPTGTTIDTFTVKDDLTDDFPPVCDETFLDAMHIFAQAQIKKELKDGACTEVEANMVRKSITEMIAAFLSMGKMKDGKVSFSRNPMFGFSTPEAKRTKAWKAAVEITGYEEPKEKAK
ncbi:hypothetical protein [Ralstonia phage RP12]|uniref:Uncharacterized protein n=1 Tax=Ralstonia phage RP12 TaxID=1923889 RepID=A0A1L7N107_9CAUD|nr:hypothetical protein FDH28_gp240 [Ralstonia phage RP12]BAW19155.1 hypothetical protein [Ralstonia phage RP12]